MAHANLIEDTSGDIVDIRYYCSDYCAKQDREYYQGWYGCQELYYPEDCHTCGASLNYYKETN